MQRKHQVSVYDTCTIKSVIQLVENTKMNITVLNSNDCVVGIVTPLCLIHAYAQELNMDNSVLHCAYLKEDLPHILAKSSKSKIAEALIASECCVVDDEIYTRHHFLQDGVM